MKACAVYARVSTDMQGESLENQVDYAQEYVRRLGGNFRLKEECVYTDFDQSGYYTRFLQRPAIQKALLDAKCHKYDVIVFKEISRISRDQAEHVEIVSRFTQYGVRIIAINDNLDSDRPETLDLLGIHSVMSEMESKRISSRVSAGKKSLARRGLWTGEAPIGFVVNRETRRLEIDFGICEIPQTIFRLFVEEKYGTFKIAEYLNGKQLFTKNGRLWSRVTVNRVLRNPAYVGDLVYGKTRNTLKRIFDESGYSKIRARSAIAKDDWVIVKGTHPALIERDMFESAQAIMATRSRQNPRRSRHPLTGILKCGRCGDGVVCQRQRYKGVEYRYYTCSRAFRFGRSLCDQPNLRASSLEQTLWAYLLKLLNNYQDGLVLVRQKDKRRLEPEKRKVQLNNELNKAQVGLKRILMETELPGTTYAKLKEHYVQLIQNAESEIQQLVSQSERINEIANWNLQVGDFLSSLKGLDLHNLDELRRVLHGLVDRIVVDGHEIREIHFKYRLS
jgi:site-specific DNA recombinase